MLNSDGDMAESPRLGILGRLFSATRYEMLLQVRRGVPWLAVLAVQTAVAGFMLYLSWLNVSTNQAYLTTPQDISIEVTRSLIDVLPMAAPLLFVVLPIILSDTIPTERRDKVFDVLRLGLSPGTYLTSKVLGVGGVLIAVTLITTAVQLALAWVIVGNADMLFFIQTAAVVWIPLLVYVVSISLLVPSGFSWRRWAWAIAAVFSLIGFGSALPVLTAPSPSSNSLVLDLLFPARAPAVQFYRQMCMFEALKHEGCVLPLRLAMLSLLPVGVQCLLAWVLAWRWLGLGEE